MESSAAQSDAMQAAANRADRAVAVLKGEGGISGIVNFEQRTPKTPLRISGEIRGLSPGKHGVTVHEFGDLSKFPKNVGNHYNPTKKEHGGHEDKIRHLGDLGNVEADENGLAKIDLTDRFLALSGQNNILGRSLVVHEQPDDLGKGTDRGRSKKTGNSGNGVAIGIIGIQKL